MALSQARLTPHHHSSGASPACSPVAASRRALHMSSRSRGCRLEDRKCPQRVPLASLVQKPKSSAQGLRSQETGRRKGRSRVRTLRDLPLSAYPWQSKMALGYGWHHSAKIHVLWLCCFPKSVCTQTHIVPTRCTFFLTGSSYITYFFFYLLYNSS